LVFSSFLGGRIFICYSRETATSIYSTLVAIAVIVLGNQIDWNRKSAYAIAVVGVLLSLICALVGANLAAYFTGTIMGKTMVWFRHEQLPLLLYGVPASIGLLSCQYVFAKILRRSTQSRQLEEEESAFIQHATIIAQVAVSGIGLIAGDLAGIGSVFWLALSTASSLLTLIINSMLAERNDVAFVSYLIGQVGFRLLHPIDQRLICRLSQLSPLLLGISGFIGFLDIVRYISLRFLILDANIDMLVRLFL
jgi:hypothetical protein